MNLVIFACPYSANLGDGLLTLCLAREIERVQPGTNVIIQDLAGRRTYGDGSGRRKMALAVLNRLPKAARAPTMALLLGFEVRRKLRPAWEEALSNANAAVLGGGNLLADADLNFPLKIAGLGAEIRKRELPWAVFGVGASTPWTKRGRHLFESALLSSAIVDVTVRDCRSKAIWNEAFASKGGFGATVCSDPAVLAFDHFPAQRRVPVGSPVLGLNITAPLELRMHSNFGTQSARLLLDWWIALVGLAAGAGYTVRLFTNGALQDEEYLLELNLRLKRTQTPSSSVIVMSRPRTPEALAAIIADCDVLAGHRLHAHIPAFSYRIPSVGFKWDMKLQSFFEGVNRGEFVVDSERISPDDVLQHILNAHARGVNEQTWLAATRMARKSIAQLLVALETAVMDTSSSRGSLQCLS